MKITPSFGLFNLILLSRLASAIEVVANSPCSSSCIDNYHGNYSDPRASSTQHHDLFCLDSHYGGGSEQESAALKWTGCLSCEGQSAAYAPGIHNDTEIDVQMFLYNLRLNFAWCVYGYDGNNLAYAGNAQQLCGAECESIRMPIIDDIYVWKSSIRYNYCNDSDSAFVNDFETCRSCLASTGNFTIMANYLKALNIACDQQPPKGKALDLGFSIFEAGRESSVTNSTGSTNSSSASASPTSQADSANSNGGGTSQGVKIGVGVGVGVGVGGALIVLALGFYFLKRHRRQQSHGTMQAGGELTSPGPAGYFNPIPPAEQKYHLVEAPTHNEPVELSSGTQFERQELDASHR